MITKTQKQTVPAAICHEWLNHRLQNAIKFALNYPTEVELIKHDLYKKVYKVRYMEGIGWHHVELTESLVRSCMKWRGQKTWTPAPDYQDIFGRIHNATQKFNKEN